jgi:arylformamidase
MSLPIRDVRKTYAISGQTLACCQFSRYVGSVGCDKTRRCVLTDPWLEREYDNGAKVPEYPAIMARWGSDAAAFRSAHPQAELSVAYGPSDRQAMDIFWPGTSRAVPILMFVHGGYWRSMDRSWFSHLACGLVARGVAVAMPSYELCPGVSLAVLVEQVRDAAGFLMARHDCDISAAGHSAGGHLTAMLLPTDWQARGVARSVRSGCAISGLFDLVPLVETSINTALRLDVAEARRLSPVHLPPPRARLRAFVGEPEGAEYLRQSRDISTAWSSPYSIIPDADHFTIIDALTDPASPMVEAIYDDMTSAKP